LESHRTKQVNSWRLALISSSHSTTLNCPEKESNQNNSYLQKAWDSAKELGMRIEPTS
jgi:hypothetical protein